jgi:hypothetical protein
MFGSIDGEGGYPARLLLLLLLVRATKSCTRSLGVLPTRGCTVHACNLCVHEPQLHILVPPLPAFAYLGHAKELWIHMVHVYELAVSHTARESIALELPLRANFGTSKTLHMCYSCM